MNRLSHNSNLSLSLYLLGGGGSVLKNGGDTN